MKNQCFPMFCLKKYKVLLNDLVSMHRGLYTHMEVEIHSRNMHTMFLFHTDFWIEFHFDKLRFMLI